MTQTTLQGDLAPHLPRADREDGSSCTEGMFEGVPVRIEGMFNADETVVMLSTNQRNWFTTRLFEWLRGRNRNGCSDLEAVCGLRPEHETVAGAYIVNDANGVGIVMLVYVAPVSDEATRSVIDDIMQADLDRRHTVR